MVDLHGSTMPLFLDDTYPLFITEGWSMVVRVIPGNFWHPSINEVGKDAYDGKMGLIFRDIVGEHACNLLNIKMSDFVYVSHLYVTLLC